MSRANQQALRFGWAEEIKRLAASGDAGRLDELVSFIKTHVDQIGVFDQHWNGVISGAVQRSIPVEITKGQALRLFREQDGRCAISREPIGFLPSRGVGRQQSRTASLDRIDSAGCYTLGNVWWVHRDINRMKSDLGLDRFVDLCRAVAATADTGLIPTAPGSDAGRDAAGQVGDVARVVAFFLRDCAQDDALHAERAQALWLRFDAWRVRGGWPVCSQTALGRALSSLGYHKSRGHFVTWHGLRLLDPAREREGLEQTCGGLGRKGK